MMKTVFVRCTLNHVTSAEDGGYPDLLKAIGDAGEAKLVEPQTWSLQVEDDFDDHQFGVALRGTVRPGDRVGIEVLTVRSLPPR